MPAYNGIRGYWNEVRVNSNYKSKNAVPQGTELEAGMQTKMEKSRYGFWKPGFLFATLFFAALLFAGCSVEQTNRTKISDLDYTIAEEGLSYHYAPPADYIEVKNAKIVKAIFDELKLPNVLGKVWTTDAIYRETKAKFDARKKEGCIAVEMELAGVQAVCDFYGWELYNFLVTGDVLDQAVYDVSGLADANHNMDKLYVAIEIAKRI